MTHRQRIQASGMRVAVPIARDNLGERIGITGKGAGLLRKKLARFGVIAQTAPYQPNVAAARYRWLLASSRA